MKLTIYLAARYSRRIELCGYREQLRALGYEVQARWLDGEHQLANDGTPIGENGEALVEAGAADEAAQLRSQFALDDWEDVSSAECVISFTEAPRSSANRGGRHVEYGIALARGARVIVVGHRENIFHWLPQVQFCERWEEALSKMTVDVPFYQWWSKLREEARERDFEWLLSDDPEDYRQAFEIGETPDQVLNDEIEEARSSC